MKHLLRMLAVLVVVSALLVACGEPPSSNPAEVSDESASDSSESTESDDAAGEEASEETEDETEGESASTGTEPTPTPAPTATTIVAEAGSGDTKLVFWNGLTGSDGQTMVEIVEQFTKENPDVSVRVEMMQWDTYFDKLLTSLISGNPPELFLLHEFEIPEFASQGVLGDTTQFFTSGGGELDDEDFPPRVIEALEYEGGRYGIPLDVHGFGMWINKDLFKEAGLDPDQPPESGEEFIEMCKQLTLDANGKHPGEEGFDPENVEQWGTVTGWMKPNFLTVMWQNGGDWIDEEGNAAINSEAGRKTLQFWYDLVHKHHCAPKPAGFDTWQAFAGGQLAMIADGTWMYNFNEENEINYGVWAYPQVGSEKPAVWTSSHVMYIPNNLSGEKLDAAERLLNYIINNTDTWATSGQPPASNSVRNSLSEDEYPTAVILGKSFIQQGRYDTAHRCISQVINEGYMPEFDSAVNGLKSVDQALDDANKRIQGILDRCS